MVLHIISSHVPMYYSKVNNSQGSSSIFMTASQLMSYDTRIYWSGYISRSYRSYSSADVYIDYIQ